MENKIRLRTINRTSNIQLAIKRMNVTGFRSLIVMDDDENFNGVLSIGDIQRAIINDLNFDIPIYKIMRHDPKVASLTTSLDEIKSEMLQFRMEFMPVITDMNKIDKVYFWDELFLGVKVPPNKKFNLPVVIMAGGFGSRLKPLTNVLPKPLIPIGEKSIIEDIFERFNEHGSNRFYISVNYKADLIEYYLVNQSLPYQMEFFKEVKPLGTAGSLFLLQGKINQTFFVSNCDILIEQDYSEILDYHRDNKNEITIVAALKQYAIPYGIIESGKNGTLIKIKEKPEFTVKINSGMYILEPHLLNEIPKNIFFHITDLIIKIKARQGKIGVFPVNEGSWRDIGDWNEYSANIKTH